MKKVLSNLKDYKKECILSPLFKMAEASIELFVPLVVKQIIDVGINENAGKTYIFKMGGMLALLAVIGLIFAVCAQYFAAKAAVCFSKKVRQGLYEHIQDFSYNEINDIGTSTLVTRLTNDVSQAQNGVNMFLRLLLRSPFVVFGAMIMAFTVNVRAALIFVVVIPMLFIVVFFIMYKTLGLYTLVQKKLDKVLLSVRENVMGVRTIRAFNREEVEKDTFTERNDDLYDTQMKVGSLSSYMNPLTYVIINMGIIYIIYQGGVRVNIGELTQGEVVALINYMSQILIEVVKLANLIITCTKAMACMNRIEEILDVKPTVENGDKDIEDIRDIEFENVSLKYNETGEPAISNISFKVNTGETIGIIGGTGSGKSSVINMVGRFYDACEGCVKINGLDVKEYNKYKLRSLIGMVPQKAVLFKGTVADNLCLGKKNISDENMMRALDIAMAKDFVMAKEGLYGEVEQGGKNFSGGQRQRLTIARALTGDPKVVILDDSSSALDYATDAKLRKAIHDNLKDIIVFIVSQRVASVRSADRIIVMDDGEIKDVGSHDYLMDNCEEYREIYYSQNEDKGGK